MLSGKHAKVINDHWKWNLRRFFAMCKSAGIEAESTKSYYHGVFGTQHLKDLTNAQWDFMFGEIELQLREKAAKDGTVFTTDLDKTIAEILGD